MKKERSDEFKEKEMLVKMNLDFIEKQHVFKMQELEYQRESDRRHHERELERGRIKSAEIRKTIWQKAENEKRKGY